MGQETKIEWTDHTFNGWIGCAHALYTDENGKQHVHQGCIHCYAEQDMDKRRHRAKWGKDGTRSRTSDQMWREPGKWNRPAQAAGKRERVFCASEADVFEDFNGPIIDHKKQTLYRDSQGMYSELFEKVSDARPATMQDLRADLFRLIDQTAYLDWLLLTKRPENISKMWIDARAGLGSAIPHRRENVWLGSSVSDQPSADAVIRELVKHGNLAPVLFLSAEPLLGPVMLAKFLAPQFAVYAWPAKRWVIVGGESGHQARPCYLQDILSIVRQCELARQPCFVKQLGSRPRVTYYASEGSDELREWALSRPHTVLQRTENGTYAPWNHQTFGQPAPGSMIQVHVSGKGGNELEWPDCLRGIKQFPGEIDAECAAKG